MTEISQRRIDRSGLVVELLKAASHERLDHQWTINFTALILDLLSATEAERDRCLLHQTSTITRASAIKFYRDEILPKVDAFCKSEGERRYIYLALVQELNGVVLRWYDFEIGGEAN